MRDKEKNKVEVELEVISRRIITEQNKTEQNNTTHNRR